jgi:hypothetical protein
LSNNNYIFETNYIPPNFEVEEQIENNPSLLEDEEKFQKTLKETLEENEYKIINNFSYLGNFSTLGCVEIKINTQEKENNLNFENELNNFEMLLKNNSKPFNLINNKEYDEDIKLRFSLEKHSKEFYDKKKYGGDLNYILVFEKYIFFILSKDDKFIITYSDNTLGINKNYKDEIYKYDIDFEIIKNFKSLKELEIIDLRKN